MIETKVRKVGNSAVMTLTSEMLAILDVKEGDSLYVVRSDDGGLGFCARSRGDRCARSGRDRHGREPGFPCGPGVKAPKWVPLTAVVVIHDRQIARHGGSAGLRDRALLEMGCARPMNLFAYGNPAIEDSRGGLCLRPCQSPRFPRRQQAHGARHLALLPSTERLRLSAGDAGRAADGRGTCLGRGRRAGFRPLARARHAAPCSNLNNGGSSAPTADHAAVGAVRRRSRISAWRTGSCGAPCACRTSCARRRGCRG